MTARGFNPKSLSIAAGLGETYVRDILAGRSKNPKTEHLGKLAAALGCSIDEIRSPTDQRPAHTDDTIKTRGELAFTRTGVFFILGNVEAGVWREAIELPKNEQEAVIFEDRPEFREGTRFGLRVQGASMDKFYPPGTILDCIKFEGMARPPRDGDHVIVYRNGPGGLVEATARELAREGQRWRLWFRSTRPGFDDPIELESAPDAYNGDGHPSNIHIVALVIGSYQRRG